MTKIDRYEALTYTVPYANRRDCGGLKPPPPPKYFGPGSHPAVSSNDVAHIDI